VADTSPLDLAFTALQKFDPSSCSGDAATDTIRLAAQFVVALPKPQRAELERRASVLGDLVAEGTPFDGVFKAIKEAFGDVLESVRRDDGSLPKTILWDHEKGQFAEVVKWGFLKSLAPGMLCTSSERLKRATLKTREGEEYEVRFREHLRRLRKPVSAARVERLINRELGRSHTVLKELRDVDSVLGAVASALPDRSLVRSWTTELESVRLHATMELAEESSLLLRCHASTTGAVNPESPDLAQLEELRNEMSPRLDSKLADIRRVAEAIYGWSKRADLRSDAARKKRSRATAAHTAVDQETPAFEVERWEDLGIGIEVKSVKGKRDQYESWPITPCPSHGDIFRKSTDHPLKLPKLSGQQWPELLKCLADSETGCTADKEDLLHGFGDYKRGPTKSLDSLGDEEIKERGGSMARKLREAISNLAARLREKVSCRETGGDPVLSVAGGRVVCARFCVRYLLRDGNNTLRFGRRDP